MHDNQKVTPINKVSIRPGVNVLSILRHLNYKPWFALAEFVDNAIQSFLVNQTRLEEPNDQKCKLLVEIDIVSEDPSRITIRDNAAGISRKDFPRAFRPAAIPPDRNGLSEFGMGMKSAACWFAPKWCVRTKAIDENVERTIRFDVLKIIHDQLEELEIIEVIASPSEHYTEVVLDNLHHFPVRRTMGKIKDHLTDIFRVFIREGILELRINGESLEYASPKILKAPFARDLDGPIREWRKDIHFDFGNGLSVSGFAGLMDPMNTSKSGFSLFRRKRLIQGSGDEGYRPENIFGQAGSFRWRRLFGELHLHGFNVSHTKDGICWDENEQPFLELLRENLEQSDLPLLRQAELHRVQPSQSEVANIAATALAKTAEAMEATLPETLPKIAEKQPVETQTTPLFLESLVASKKLQVNFKGQSWKIHIELTNDPAKGEWLEISDQFATEDAHQTIEIRISIAHPFMVNFAQQNPNDVEALIRIASALALSEVLARHAGVKMSGTIRRNVNEILRDALSRP